MLSTLLNALQLFLIPLVIGLVALAVAVVWLLGRQRRGQGAAASDRPAAAAEAGPAGPDDSGFGAEPAVAAAATAPAPAAPALPLAADLLLVDDSAVARAKLRKLFEPAGYRVQLARDGVEALALLGQGRYALMITDLEMPNLDGVALIGACQGQARTADMPILAITGHDDLQARLDECRQICGIYRKPWIDEDLASHVAALVSTRSARSAAASDA